MPIKIQRTNAYPAPPGESASTQEIARYLRRLHDAIVQADHARIGDQVYGINTIPTGNEIVGVNAGADRWEYKTLNQALVAGLTVADSPTFAGATFSGLTASLPVLTNGSKALASVSYADFKTSLAITVANLGDAAWTSFTPAWTNLTKGSGTNEGLYKQIGKTVLFRVRFIMAADSSISGVVTLTLPVTAATYSSAATIGTGYIYDADPGVIYQIVVSSAGAVLAIGSGGTYATLDGTSSSVPMTWTTSDIISLHGFYEAA